MTSVETVLFSTVIVLNNMNFCQVCFLYYYDLNNVYCELYIFNK